MTWGKTQEGFLAWPMTHVVMFPGSQVSWGPVVTLWSDLIARNAVTRNVAGYIYQYQ